MTRKTKTGEWEIVVEFDVHNMNDWDKGNKSIETALENTKCEESGAGTGFGVRDVSIICPTESMAKNTSEKIRTALKKSGWGKTDHPRNKQFSIEMNEYEE